MVAKIDEVDFTYSDPASQHCEEETINSYCFLEATGDCTGGKFPKVISSKFIEVKGKCSTGRHPELRTGLSIVGPVLHSVKCLSL